jgi:hypothetical protein
MKPQRMAGRILTLILFLLGASLAQQSEKYFLRYVPGGYMSTGDFSDLPATEQYGYAMGFVNGIMTSGILGADLPKVEMMNRCTTQMQAKQIAAIIDKYVKDHPESWHEPLAVHSFNALLDVCPDLKKRILVPNIPK